MAAVLWIWALGRSAERYPFGRDVRDARSYLSAIEGAEDRCFAWVGAYVPLSRLGPTGCGGLPEGLASGTHDGFNIQVDGGLYLLCGDLACLRAEARFAFFRPDEEDPYRPTNAAGADIALGLGQNDRASAERSSFAKRPWRGNPDGHRPQLQRQSQHHFEVILMTAIVLYRIDSAKHLHRF